MMRCYMMLEFIILVHELYQLRRKKRRMLIYCPQWAYPLLPLEATATATKTVATMLFEQLFELRSVGLLSSSKLFELIRVVVIFVVVVMVGPNLPGTTPCPIASRMVLVSVSLLLFLLVVVVVVVVVIVVVVVVVVVVVCCMIIVFVVVIVIMIITGIINCIVCIIVTTMIVLPPRYYTLPYCKPDGGIQEKLRPMLRHPILCYAMPTV